MGQRQARNINIGKLVKHMIIVKMKKGFIVTKLDNSHLSKNLDINCKLKPAFALTVYLLIKDLQKDKVMP